MIKPYPADVFDSFNPFTGEFTIINNDKSRDETLIFMMVTCSSTLAKGAPPAMSAFPVGFYDECRFAQVQPPRRSDMFADLFIPAVYGYNEPTVKDATGKLIECGPITTTLIGVEPNYPDIEHRPDIREIRVHATDESHLDEYPLMFESCITFRGGPYACRNSTVFQVKVANPCDTTIVRSNPIPSGVLSARITEYDELDLR